MTLRARLAVLTSLAVALAVLAASVAAWFLIRSTLLSEVDQRLLDRVPDLDRVTRMIDPAPEGTEQTRLLLLQGDPIGVQRIDPDGRVVGRLPPADEAFPLDAGEQSLLAGEASEPQLRTVVVDGQPHRVMTAALPTGGAVRLVQPLGTVEQTMTRMAWLLVAVAGVGVAVAGGLGWLIARAGLRPVDRLADAAEQVAATKDLAHRVRVDTRARDEVTRLAGSMNAMLAALERARVQQRQLVEDAGHELRTPLTTLRNDVGLLVRAQRHPERAFSAADRESLLRELDAEVAALAELVEELVALARGGVEPEPLVETDLRVLVERAVARTRRVSPGVRVAVSGASAEVPVRPATLERAVANLVRNAVQVSPDRGTVEVTVAESPDWATVRVSDRGPGIAEHDLPRLFDRFYRGEGARTRQGSGLGLAIVAQAVEQHHGTVTAENRPGGGAVFTLRVPARAAPGDERVSP